MKCSKIVINKLELLRVERGKCEGANILINCIRVECKNGMRVEEMGKQSINLLGFDTGELRRSVIHNYIICNDCADIVLW